MQIEKILRDYKQNKALVETTQARINVYKQMLQQDNIDDYIICVKSNNIGMPNARRISSPVEKALERKMLDAETLREWIREDQSRIWLKKIETEQVEIAIAQLQEEKRYIIELKYFENRNWSNIEYNYNNRYRRGTNGIGNDRLKQLHREALKFLGLVLVDYFKKWETA